jgi:predicted nucleotidyltransferase
LPDGQIADFCRRHRVRKLSLFGSALRQDFMPESDVDFLVEFEPDYRIGYFGLAGMEMELSELIGRKADLRTPEELSRHFRQQVVDTAEVKYAG